MSIPVSCGCGKELLFADEHEGKRVRCPGCQALLSISMPPLEDVPPVAKGERWSIADPAVCFVIGGMAVVVLIVVALMATSSPHDNRPLEPVDIADHVAKTMPSFAYVANPSVDQIAQWRAYARYRAENVIDAVFRSKPDVKSFLARSADVHPAEPDPRKRSWLWTAVIRVETHFEDGQDREFILRSLFRMVPPDNFEPIWTDIAEGGTLNHSRSHADYSEWNPDFRKTVKAAWKTRQSD